MVLATMTVLVMEEMSQALVASVLVVYMAVGAAIMDLVMTEANLEVVETTTILAITTTVMTFWAQGGRKL